MRLKPALPRVVKGTIIACAVAIGAPLDVAIWFHVAQLLEGLNYLVER